MEELGEFLRSRRSRLSPEDAGVRTYGDRRREPGSPSEAGLRLLAGLTADQREPARALSGHRQ